MKSGPHKAYAHSYATIHTQECQQLLKHRIMDLFNYLTIIFSLLYSVAILRLIGGLSSAFKAESRYWVHLLFVFLTIFSIIYSFWTFWAFRYVDWTLPLVLFHLIVPAIYSFMASVLIPENPGEIKSWKDYYYLHKNKYFFAFLILIIYVFISGFIHDLPFNDVTRIAQLVAFIPIIFGLRSSKHSVHLVLALFYLIQILVLSFTVAVEPGWLFNR